MKNKTKQDWKLINIKSGTKDKLEAICDAMSNDYARVALSTLLDKIINDKYDQVFNDKK
jgi:hypothetical protein